MTGRARSVRLAGIVLAVVAIPGCGSPTPSVIPTGGAPVAGCALVPTMDALVGRPSVAPPGGYTVGTSDRCIWAFSVDPARHVGLTVGASGSHAATVGALGEGEPVGDLGVEARWWAGPRTLSAVVGERSFQVDLELGAGEGSRELAVAIARQVLERLP